MRERKPSRWYTGHSSADDLIEGAEITTEQDFARLEPGDALRIVAPDLHVFHIFTAEDGEPEQATVDQRNGSVVEVRLERVETRRFRLRFRNSTDGTFTPSGGSSAGGKE